jgi:hypothetical protein
MESDKVPGIFRSLDVDATGVLLPKHVKQWFMKSDLPPQTLRTVALARAGAWGAGALLSVDGPRRAPSLPPAPRSTIRARAQVWMESIKKSSSRDGLDLNAFREACRIIQQEVQAKRGGAGGGTGAGPSAGGAAAPPQPVPIDQVCAVLHWERAALGDSCGPQSVRSGSQRSIRSVPRRCRRGAGIAHLTVAQERWRRRHGASHDAQQPAAAARRRYQRARADSVAVFAGHARAGPIAVRPAAAADTEGCVLLQAGMSRVLQLAA